MIATFLAGIILGEKCYIPVFQTCTWGKNRLNVRYIMIYYNIRMNAIGFHVLLNKETDRTFLHSLLD